MMSTVPVELALSRADNVAAAEEAVAVAPDVDVAAAPGAPVKPPTPAAIKLLSDIVTPAPAAIVGAPLMPADSCGLVAAAM